MGYTFAGKHNGKPMYQKAGSNYVIRWEEAAMGDWGAVNLGGNKNVWVVVGKGHHRFFVPSDDETPPASGWTARSTTAEGKLLVETSIPGSASGSAHSASGSAANAKGSAASASDSVASDSVASASAAAAGSGDFKLPAEHAKLAVMGASGVCGTKANGQYEPFDSHSGKPVWKNTDGYVLQFESAVKEDWAAEHIGKNKDVWVIKTKD